MADYLTEDQDLLDELEAIGPLSTGRALSEQERIISVIQIKTMLRQRKSADDVEKSNTRFSIIIIAFTIVQMIIALCQFIFDIQTIGHGWIPLLVSSLLLAGVIATFKIFDPDKILKK
jgi:hypothetical protein